MIAQFLRRLLNPTAKLRLWRSPGAVCVAYSAEDAARTFRKDYINPIGSRPIDWTIWPHDRPITLTERFAIEGPVILSAVAAGPVHEVKMSVVGKDVIRTVTADPSWWCQQGRRVIPCTP